MVKQKYSEPRIINIETFKAGSTQSGTSLATTTSVYGAAFSESEINVIKLKPDNAPSITTASTSRSGSTTGLGLNRVTCNKNFTETYNGDKDALMKDVLVPPTAAEITARTSE